MTKFNTIVERAGYKAKLGTLKRDTNKEEKVR